MATKKKTFKIGDRVKWTRRNGVVASGRVSGTDDMANGRWIAVNTARKGDNPEITNVRESMLSAA